MDKFEFPAAHVKLTIKTPQGDVVIEGFNMRIAQYPSRMKYSIEYEYMPLYIGTMQAVEQVPLSCSVVLDVSGAL